MMRPCSECESSSWVFSHLDGWITAVCKNCDHTVTFQKKKKEKAKEQYDGDPCKRCGNKLMTYQYTFNPSKLKQPFYFTHSMKCTSCGLKWLQERHKVVNKDFKGYRPEERYHLNAAGREAWDKTKREYSEAVDEVNAICNKNYEENIEEIDEYNSMDEVSKDCVDKKSCDHSYQLAGKTVVGHLVLFCTKCADTVTRIV